MLHIRFNHTAGVFDLFDENGAWLTARETLAEAQCAANLAWADRGFCREANEIDDATHAYDAAGADADLSRRDSLREEID